MSLLLFYNNGLPKNGLVALFDPYLDTLGRNMTANPLMGGTYVGGIAPSWVANGTPTITENTDPAYIKYGKKSQRVQTSSTLHGLSQALGRNIGATYTLTCSVFIVTGRVRCYYPDDTYDTSPSGYTGWYLFSKTTTSASNTNWGTYVASNGGATDFYLDAHKVELGSAFTGFNDYSGLPQSALDRIHGINLQSGSTAGTDTNDFAFTGTGIQHTTNQYGLSAIITNVDMRSFSEILVGKFNGTSGVIFSLADPTTTTKYQAIKQAASGKLSILSRNGGTETESARLDVSTTATVALLFTASGGVLTLTNLSTGASVTLTDTAPVASPRIGMGCVASSTVAQVVSAMTWNVSAPYSRLVSLSEANKDLKYLRKLEAARGVTVA